MDEKELSLLSHRQIEQLSILRKSSILSKPTDLACLCGYYGGLTGDACRFYTSDDTIAAIDPDGISLSYGAWFDCYAVRPTLKLSSSLFEQISSQIIVDEKGLKKVNYGEYPQQVVAPSWQKLMEREYSKGALRKTSACYVLGDDLRCDVYEYFGKRYIRVLSKSKTLTFSNDFVCSKNNPAWVEISPVEWLVDDDTRTLVAKNGLLSGILYKRYKGSFETSMMKKYLDTHMLRDLFQPYNTHRELADKVAIVNDRVASVLEFLSSHAGMDSALDELYHLLDKYNLKINESYLDANIVSRLYDELLGELEKFLIQKKEKTQKFNEYYNMMDYIQKCIDILNNKTVNNYEDELLNSICSVRNFEIEIVNLGEFIKFLYQCEADILAYVDGSGDISETKYKTLEEFKKIILEKLQSLLVYQNGIGLTILTPEEVKKLEVLKKYGSVSVATDLAILMGSISHYSKDMHGMVGPVWLNSYGGEKEYEYVDVDGKINKSGRSASQAAIRPAFYAGREFSQLLAQSTSKYGILSEVTCGEYPQFVPSKRIQNILGSKFAKGLLKPTGRTYTLICSDNHGHFKPNKVIEYEYNDKKYVLVESESYVSRSLSGGQQIKGRESVWVEVTPVVWLIDKETKMLVSKYALMSGIEFDGLCRDFEFSQVGMFIGKYMARDIFQSTDLNKTIGVGSKTVNAHANEKTSEIATLVEEIKDLLASYYGSEDIMGRVQTLITKYNSDIDKAYDDKNSGFVLTMPDVDKDFLYAKLISDLEDVLSDVKRLSEKYIEYTKMLKLTEKCISILNGDNVEDEDDDLIKDIITIKKVVLPFLNDEGKKSEIIAIFTDYEKEINEYLNGNEDSKIKKYKTLTEYKLAIRKELQPYLINLSTSVRNKDMVNEIKSGYIKMLDGLFVKSKNEYINSFLMEVKKLIDEISVRGNSVEKEKMQKILADKSEFGDDLTENLIIVVSLYKDLYGIVLDIESREKKQMEHDKYKIDIQGFNFSK